MPEPPFVHEHIATDPMHIIDEARYAVKRVADDSVVSTHKWAGEAADKARRLSIEAGACPQCGGEGSIVAEYDHGNAIGETCPTCDGSGKAGQMTEQTWFYLSFADGELPTGTQFLGGVYIRANDGFSAISGAHLLGINPGGEVKFWGPFPDHVIAAAIPEGDRERLLSKDEIEAHGPVSQGGRP